MKKKQAKRVLDALRAAREMFYTLGDEDTQMSRECYDLCVQCDKAIAQIDETVCWKMEAV